MSGTDGVDRDIVAEDKNRMNISCVSFHASRATFVARSTFLVGLKGEIITAGSDRKHRADNTNGLNCTLATESKNDISSVREEKSTKSRVGEIVVNCVLYFDYAYCTSCAVYSFYQHDKNCKDG